MRCNKLFIRERAKKGTGSQVKYAHLQVPEDVAAQLRLYREYYSKCFGKKVTLEQMLRRWIDQMNRIDKDVYDAFQKAQKAKADTETKVQKVKETVLAPEAQKEPWERKYFFTKGEERMEALPGDVVPFYARKDGRNIGIQWMLQNGWSLIDENGNKIESVQAERIRNLMKAHEKGK